METKKTRSHFSNNSPRSQNSNGGNGRNPRAPQNNRVSTGGNSNPRNRKWIMRKIFGRFSKRTVENIPHENFQNGNTINSVELINCEIYLDTDDITVAENFYKSFLNVLETVDLDLSKESPAVIGSWYKKFWLNSKNFTNKEIATRLEKVERGIELQYIDKVQSEVDLNIANAIGILLTSTKDIPQFSSLVGSLLFAKVTVNGEPRIFAQTLTQEQLRILRDTPSLLQNPSMLILKMEEEKNKVLAENKVKQIAGK